MLTPHELVNINLQPVEQNDIYNLIDDYGYKMVQRKYYNATQWFIPEYVHIFTVMDINATTPGYTPDPGSHIVKLYPRFRKNA